ncbi:MAG: enoyl-CoA hydratase [Pseudonocardiales bacterium]|nr:enoyl-CoA hydratase [Pseudonocardiales bacterium]
MAGRFSRPVWPGDTLTISIWTYGPNARFQTKRQDGTVVIDRGTASIRS